RSVHGLVVKPWNDTVTVAIEGNQASIRAENGLTLSALEQVRQLDAGNAAEFRDSYLDLVTFRADNPAQLAEQREAMISHAANSEGRMRDVARLDLAQFYVANGLAHEAIGVLGVLRAELMTDDLAKKVRL